MIYGLLITLLISQIVTAYFLIDIYKSRKSEKKIPEGSVILEPIPSKPEYSDVEPDFKTMYDVIESAVLENWTWELKPDSSIGSTSWKIDIKSHDSSVTIMARLRQWDEEVHLSNFIITSSDGSRISPNYSSNKKNIQVENDLKVFCWKYIIDYYKKENSDTRQYYSNAIKSISSKLKTLNRSRRLNDILDEI